MSDYTYDEYLETFEDMFGDVDEADYHYWKHGKKVPCVIKRLTFQQFTEHVAACDKYSAAWDAAYKADDGAAMDAVLDESFPHELVLLL